MNDIEREVAAANQGSLDTLRADVRLGAVELVAHLRESKGTVFQHGILQSIADLGERVVWSLLDSDLLPYAHYLTQDGDVAISKLIRWAGLFSQERWSELSVVDVDTLSMDECVDMLNRYTRVRNYK